MRIARGLRPYVITVVVLAIVALVPARHTGSRTRVPTSGSPAAGVERGEQAPAAGGDAAIASEANGASSGAPTGGVNPGTASKSSTGAAVTTPKAATKTG